MKKEQIDDFIKERLGRLTEIEMAVQLIEIIGRRLNDGGPEIRGIKYTGGPAYQFFAFMQRSLSILIFVSFSAVIGNYDSKKKTLKAWELMPFKDHTEKNSSLGDLLNIKNRYDEARNNSICHIGDKLEKPLPTFEQVTSDVAEIRRIFNCILIANGLPPIVHNAILKKQHPVQGIEEIFKNLYPSGGGEE